MKNDKRILFIDLSLMISGSQKVTLNILDELIDDGYSVSSIIRKRDGEINGHYNKKCKVYYFWFERLISNVFCSGDFSYSKIVFLNKIKILLLLIAMNFQVVIHGLSNGVKTIYCYDPKGLVSCGLLAKLLGFKLIWHLHGELNFPLKIQKAMIRMASKIIVPSQYIRFSLPRNNKTVVIYNGFVFDEKKIKKIHKQNDSLRLVYSGTIVPHKGLHLLLQQLNKYNRHENIPLTILGIPVGNSGGRYLAYIKTLVSLLPSNVSVSFEGWVSNPLDYYSEADVTVFTSVKSGEVIIDDEIIYFRSSEALPTSIIESLSVGTPVVAYDVAGVREIITERDDGFVISEHSDLLETLFRAKNDCTVDRIKTINKFNAKEMFFNFKKII